MASFDNYTCSECRFYKSGSVETTDVQGGDKLRVQRIRRGLATCGKTGEPVKPSDALCLQGRVS